MNWGTSELGDRAWESRVLGSLGNSFSDIGQNDKAIEFHTKSLTISRELGDRPWESVVLGNLGNAFIGLGHIDKAIELYVEHNLK